MGSWRYSGLRLQGGPAAAAAAAAGPPGGTGPGLPLPPAAPSRQRWRGRRPGRGPAVARSGGCGARLGGCSWPAGIITRQHWRQTGRGPDAAGMATGAGPAAGQPCTGMAPRAAAAARGGAATWGPAVGEGRQPAVPWRHRRLQHGASVCVCLTEAMPGYGLGRGPGGGGPPRDSAGTGGGGDGGSGGLGGAVASAGLLGLAAANPPLGQRGWPRCLGPPTVRAPTHRRGWGDSGGPGVEGGRESGGSLEARWPTRAWGDRASLHVRQEGARGTGGAELLLL